jgi:hypothetical protein
MPNQTNKTSQSQLDKLVEMKKKEYWGRLTWMELVVVRGQVDKWLDSAIREAYESGGDEAIKMIGLKEGWEESEENYFHMWRMKLNS